MVSLLIEFNVLDDTSITLGHLRPENDVDIVIIDLKKFLAGNDVIALGAAPAVDEYLINL